MPIISPQDGADYDLFQLTEKVDTTDPEEVRSILIQAFDNAKKATFYHDVSRHTVIKLYIDTYKNGQTGLDNPVITAVSRLVLYVLTLPVKSDHYDVLYEFVKDLCTRLISPMRLMRDLRDNKEVTPAQRKTGRASSTSQLADRAMADDQEGTHLEDPDGRELYGDASALAASVILRYLAQIISGGLKGSRMKALQLLQSTLANSELDDLEAEVLSLLSQALIVAISERAKDVRMLAIDCTQRLSIEPNLSNALRHVMVSDDNYEARLAAFKKLYAFATPIPDSDDPDYDDVMYNSIYHDGLTLSQHTAKYQYVDALILLSRMRDVHPAIRLQAIELFEAKELGIRIGRDKTLRADYTGSRANTQSLLTYQQKLWMIKQGLVDTDANVVKRTMNMLTKLFSVKSFNILDFLSYLSCGVTTQGTYIQDPNSIPDIMKKYRQQRQSEPLQLVSQLPVREVAKLTTASFKMLAKIEDNTARVQRDKEDSLFAEPGAVATRGAGTEELTFNPKGSPQTKQWVEHVNKYCLPTVSDAPITQSAEQGSHYEDLQTLVSYIVATTSWTFGIDVDDSSTKSYITVERRKVLPSYSHHAIDEKEVLKSEETGGDELVKDEVGQLDEDGMEARQGGNPPPSPDSDSDDEDMDDNSDSSGDEDVHDEDESRKQQRGRSHRTKTKKATSSTKSSTSKKTPQKNKSALTRLNANRSILELIPFEKMLSRTILLFQLQWSLDEYGVSLSDLILHQEEYAIAASSDSASSAPQLLHPDLLDYTVPPLTLGTIMLWRVLLESAHGRGCHGYATNQWQVALSHPTFAQWLAPSPPTIADGLSHVMFPAQQHELLLCAQFVDLHSPDIALLSQRGVELLNLVELSTAHIPLVLKLVRIVQSALQNQHYLQIKKTQQLLTNHRDRTQRSNGEVAEDPSTTLAVQQLEAELEVLLNQPLPSTSVKLLQDSFFATLMSLIHEYSNMQCPIRQTRRTELLVKHHQLHRLISENAEILASPAPVVKAGRTKASAQQKLEHRQRVLEEKEKLEADINRIRNSYFSLTEDQNFLITRVLVVCEEIIRAYYDTFHATNRKDTTPERQRQQQASLEEINQILTTCVWPLLGWAPYRGSNPDTGETVETYLILDFYSVDVSVLLLNIVTLSALLSSDLQYVELVIRFLLGYTDDGFTLHEAPTGGKPPSFAHVVSAMKTTIAYETSPGKSCPPRINGTGCSESESISETSSIPHVSQRYQHFDRYLQQYMAHKDKFYDRSRLLQQQEYSTLFPAPLLDPTLEDLDDAQRKQLQSQYQTQKQRQVHVDCFSNMATHPALQFVALGGISDLLLSFGNIIPITLGQHQLRCLSDSNLHREQPATHTLSYERMVQSDKNNTYYDGQHSAVSMNRNVAPLSSSRDVNAHHSDAVSSLSLGQQRALAQLGNQLSTDVVEQCLLKLFQFSTFVSTAPYENFRKHIIHAYNAVHLVDYALLLKKYPLFDPADGSTGTKDVDPSTASHLRVGALPPLPASSSGDIDRGYDLDDDDDNGDGISASQQRRQHRRLTLSDRFQRALRFYSLSHTIIMMANHIDSNGHYALDVNLTGDLFCIGGANSHPMGYATYNREQTTTGPEADDTLSAADRETQTMALASSKSLRDRRTDRFIQYFFGVNDIYLSDDLYLLFKPVKTLKEQYFSASAPAAGLANPETSQSKHAIRPDSNPRLTSIPYDMLQHASSLTEQILREVRTSDDTNTSTVSAGRRRNAPKRTRGKAISAASDRLDEFLLRGVDDDEDSEGDDDDGGDGIHPMDSDKAMAEYNDAFYNIDNFVEQTTLDAYEELYGSEHYIDKLTLERYKDTFYYRIYLSIHRLCTISICKLLLLDKVPYNYVQQFISLLLCVAIDPGTNPALQHSVTIFFQVYCRSLAFSVGYDEHYNHHRLQSLLLYQLLAKHITYATTNKAKTSGIDIDAYPFQQIPPPAQRAVYSAPHISSHGGPMAGQKIDPIFTQYTSIEQITTSTLPNFDLLLGQSSLRESIWNHPAVKQSMKEKIKGEHHMAAPQSDWSLALGVSVCDHQRMVVGSVLPAIGLLLGSTPSYNHHGMRKAFRHLNHDGKTYSRTRICHFVSKIVQLVTALVTTTPPAPVGASGTNTSLHAQYICSHVVHHDVFHPLAASVSPLLQLGYDLLTFVSNTDFTLLPVKAVILKELNQWNMTVNDWYPLYKALHDPYYVKIQQEKEEQLEHLKHEERQSPSALQPSMRIKTEKDEEHDTINETNHEMVNSSHSGSGAAKNARHTAVLLEHTVTSIPRRAALGFVLFFQSLLQVYNSVRNDISDYERVSKPLTTQFLKTCEDLVSKSVFFIMEPTQHSTTSARGQASKVKQEAKLEAASDDDSDDEYAESTSHGSTKQADVHKTVGYDQSHPLSESNIEAEAHRLSSVHAISLGALTQESPFSLAQLLGKHSSTHRVGHLRQHGLVFDHFFDTFNNEIATFMEQIASQRYLHYQKHFPLLQASLVAAISGITDLEDTLWGGQGKGTRRGRSTQRSSKLKTEDTIKDDEDISQHSDDENDDDDDASSDQDRTATPRGTANRRGRASPQIKKEETSTPKKTNSRSASVKKESSRPAKKPTSTPTRSGSRSSARNKKEVSVVKGERDSHDDNDDDDDDDLFSD